MKIKRITFENFRNFKDRGVIECSTDGKVTIVYGKNGDGKTTLHQFFQWLFYGETHFNKTTTGRLYNLEFENAAEYGQVFRVYGSVDFEHNGIDYALTRINEYKKGLNESTLLGSDLSLLAMDADNNWKSIDKPEETIEKLLPSGLAEYFFFDGESMIADLKTTGKDSAGKLKKALYSIFDLDSIEAAINHIGRKDLQKTVIGSIFSGKGVVYSDQKISQKSFELQTAQNKRDDFEKQIENNKNKIAELSETVNKISEKIGSSKSKEQYENDRSALKNQLELFSKNAEKSQSDFGESLIDMYPKLLISKAVKDAGSKIHMQVEKYKLPSGINKTLISYLLDANTTKCVCGKELCEEEKKHIEQYLNYMPPRSYAQFYMEFKTTAENWGKEYDSSKLSEHIKTVIDNNSEAEKCVAAIKKLDEEEKKSPDISQLIADRITAEAKIDELSDENEYLNIEKKKYEALVKKLMGELSAMTSSTAQGALANRKISIMEQVLSHFILALDDASKKYSKELQNNIQELVDGMLTSKRIVRVSSEFAVTITDSYKDESKSEGQFAVVSFAYIGGIFKLLKGNERLSNKEYPLILDGPFSKLDIDQRQNVVDTIPEFAPQVILFSKDSLQEVFAADKIGKVWTIQSNLEKNVATVKEGFLWS